MKHLFQGTGLCFLLCLAALAQPAETSEQEKSVLFIEARAKAKSVRFETDPVIKSSVDTWFTKRTNLPENVEPKKTYRNVEIETRLSIPLEVERHDALKEHQPNPKEIEETPK